VSKKNFTIGADPELFMREKDSQKLKSAIPYIEGTKLEPEVLECGAGLQRDNVALEFASTVADSGAAFVKSIGNALKEIIKKLPEGHEIVAIPSARFDEDQLDHPEARMFGCSPDYDAYIPAQNPPAYCEDEAFRSCGGHIHLGYVEGSGNEFLLDNWGKINTIITMDAFHGIASVILDSSKEAAERRKLYGKAGCHRPTEYGVEYRALSNFWIKSPELVMLMYQLSEDVLRLMRDGTFEILIEDIGKNTLQDVINSGKVEEATDILENKVKPMLSVATVEVLDMCLEKCGQYEFKQEWRLETAA